jgi:soluble lytic murein transglycosylase
MRRLLLLILLAAVAAGAFLYVDEATPPWFERIRYPLRYPEYVRVHARENGLDPALLAAVIYQESKFSDRTSAAGAEGLMQILPSTARFIAKRSGGTAFVPSDLGTPQVNIAYGAYYLRYLLRRYDGNVTLAVAAYNAGETNVNNWVHEAGGADSFDADRDIPFGETRDYVHDVKQRRQEYRDHYGDELGL